MEPTLETLVEQAKGGNKNTLEALIERIQDRVYDLAMVVSLLAWFVPDTALSLLSGFWQNAALNLVFAVLFALPLAATSGAFNEKRP